VSRLGRDFRELLYEQIEYRELLAQMTRRDLLLRYKQTVMGFGWAIFMPLVNTIVFSIIFTRVARVDVGVPYPVFAYCGLLPWNFFASSVRFSVTSLTSNTNLVTKVYFPREIFPFSAVLVGIVDFFVGFTVLLLMMLYYRVPFTPWILFLPVVLAVQATFTAGAALFFAMANLFYRDVKYLFEIVITLWMFLTSVIYPVELVGGRLGWLLGIVNPMSPIIDAYRSILIKGTPPNMISLGWAASISVVFLMAAWVSFHRSEFTFAENI
jgi:lipopolysaccharide transport system permease protein